MLPLRSAAEPKVVQFADLHVFSGLAHIHTHIVKLQMCCTDD